MKTETHKVYPLNRDLENPFGIQHDPINYYMPNYLSPKRMSSYGYQYKLAIESAGNTFLNIGSANNILSDLLIRQHKHVINLDLDVHTVPTVTATFPYVPFVTNAFDVVLCFQVLEHLPFNMLQISLTELKRLAGLIIISLPDITLTKRERQKYEFFRTFHFPKEWKIYKPRYVDIEHFWEIGDGKVTLEHIYSTFENANLSIIKHFRNDLGSSHHFFVLKN